MSSKIEIRKICMTNFLNQLGGFMTDILIILPNNEEIMSAKKYVATLSVANPKLLLTYWHNSVTMKYSEQIYKNDFEFALNKDYGEDLKENQADNAETILKLIDNLKKTAKELNEKEKATIMKYLQNITKLTELYHENN